MTEKQLKQIAKFVYPDYKGRKIRYSVMKNPINCNWEANWSGGSKIYYKFVRLDTGKILSVPDFAPWKRPDDMIIEELPEGCACVTHTFFCGHDLGLHVYLPKLTQIN